MVGHLFQNYDTIYVRFFPTYTCNHSCYTIYVRFFATYTCVLSCFVGLLFPSIWPFSYKRAYICAQKSPYICVTNKHVYMGLQKVVVWETPSYTVSKKLLHVRWSWKVTSVRIKHGRNSRVAWTGRSFFFSLSRAIITFSPPRTRSKPPSLEAFYSFPPFTL